MPINVPPKGNADKVVGSYFAPLRVEAQVAPDLTVKIRAGSFWTALAAHVEYPGGNSPAIAPPSADAKWVVITMKESGTINVLNGAAGTSPDLPAIPETELPLAGIFIGDTATEITSDMVFDIRPLWQLRAENIVDLQGELDDRPTTVDVNALLALKADIGGTPETVFTLNQDQVGVPGSDVDLEVERGSAPNVSIRWNESSETWEFTNDGVTFADIGAAAGSFYTQAALDGGALDPRYYTKVQLDAGSLSALYYTQAAADALFALLGHSHVAADITDFDAAVAATAGLVFAPTVHTHVAADTTDFAAAAVAAGTGVFATFAHPHVAADVTDFDAAADARIALADIQDLANVSTTAFSDGEVLAWNPAGPFFTNRLLVTDDLDDVDTTTSALVDKQALMWNGVNQFVNRAIVLADVSDFVGTDFVHTTGVETIMGDKTFTGDVTIGGGVVNLTATQLQVTDDVIEINFGETGAGVDGGTGNAGLLVSRGTLVDAVLQWEEGTQQWLIGTIGSTLPILTGAHTHPAAQITDFAVAVTAELNTNPIDEMSDVVSAGHALNDFLLSDGTDFNATSFSVAVTAELALNQLEDVGDVKAYAGLAAQDVLLWDGGEWENRPVVKADVSDFVEGDYVHTTGVELIAGAKTFSGDMILNGDLTVNGTTTTIDTANLAIEDNVIVLNNGEAGAGVTANDAGIEIDRGSLTDARLTWDEANLQFRAGIIGFMSPLALVGHTHVQANITDVSASAAEVSFLAGVTSLVQAQINSKIGRAGDAMDAGANLTFSATGEVLGLPAIPSATGAASKEYVDSVALAQDELAELVDIDLDGASDLGPAAPALADQDALMYDIANTRWTNRPFVEADISDLGLTILENSDIGSTVQAQDDTLDDLAALGIVADNEFIVGTAAGVFAFESGATVRTSLDVYGTLELDGSAGSAGAKINKVSGAAAGDVATMTAAGDVASSGTLLSALALTADHYTKVENDAAAGSAGAKIDKVAGVAGNVIEFGAAAAVVDSGIASADILTLTTTGEIAHTIGNLGDVTDASSTGDYLRKSAGDWLNVAPALMSEFVRTQGTIAESITGDKTFSDDVVIDGNLTVNGTTTTINTTNLDVTDQVIRVNDGYVGVAIGNSGLEANRTGAADVANWLWDEGGTIGLNTTPQKWVGGIAGFEAAFATENATIAQPNYELFVGTGAGLPTYVAAATVAVPAGGKAGIQVFVNGIKQIEGGAKAYTVGSYAPVTITFTAGNEPAVSDDVEIYSFGTIG